MKFSFNMLYFIKKQYFKTQLINTEHRTQDTDTGLRTQTHAKNTLLKNIFLHVYLRKCE